MPAYQPSANANSSNANSSAKNRHPAITQSQPARRPVKQVAALFIAPPSRQE
jgi:hypothetical protein